MDRLLTYLHLAHIIIKISMDLITLWGQVRTDVSTSTYKVPDNGFFLFLLALNVVMYGFDFIAYQYLF